MKEDNFMIYIGAIYLTLQLTSIFYISSLWVMLLVPAYFLFIVGFVAYGYDREVKWYSPFPVKLDGRWTWHFYVIRGSHMVHPTVHLYNKISGEGQV